MSYLSIEVYLIESNQYYSSVDVVLYSRHVLSGLELLDNQIDALVLYPHNKQDEKYTIPDGVTIRGNHFFF